MHSSYEHIKSKMRPHADEINRHNPAQGKNMHAEITKGSGITTNSEFPELG